MTDLAVAEEIIRQMGGAGRLKAMIGARHFAGGPDGVQFKWAAKSRGGTNAVKIRLTPTDVYEVTFYRIRSTPPVNVTELKTYGDVYGDQLVEIFEQQTGLYLRL